MSIQNLEVDLDLKQNLNIRTTCKQLDDVTLICNIYDNGTQADLSNYNVRLKALKSDKIPLVQEHVGITILNNVVTIVTDSQLTTTSGKTLIELQFINKTTGLKKATFNLILNVIASTLEVNATVSTSTYTLLQELENKLDQASDFFENIVDAMDANTDLVNSTNTANTTKTALDASNTTALATKSALDTSNTNATTTKNALNTSITNANNSKTALDTSKSNADTTKTALDTSVANANTFVSQHGDIINLDNRVTTNTNSITSINASLSNNTQQISDISKDNWTWTKNNKGTVVFQFDDGLQNIYDVAYPVLKNAGFPFDIAVSLDISFQKGNAGGYMNPKQLLELRDYGVEFMHHGATHKQLYSARTETQARYEFEENMRLAKKLGVYMDGFVAPIETNDEPGVADVYKPLVAEYANYSIHDYVYGAYQPASKTSSQGLVRCAMRDGVDAVKSYIDQAIANGDWIVLWCHKITDDEVPLANFQAIIDYAKAKQDAGLLEVKTIKQVYEENTTMFSKSNSYKKNSFMETITHEPSPNSDNVFFNNFFNQNGLGWTISKDTNVSYVPSTRFLAVTFATASAIGATFTLSQKVNARDFYRQPVEGDISILPYFSNDYEDLFTLQVKIEVYDSTDTLVDTFYCKTNTLHHSWYSDVYKDKFVLPFNANMNYFIVSYIVTKTGTSTKDNRIDLYYPQLSLHGIKSPCVQDTSSLRFIMSNTSDFDCNLYTDIANYSGTLQLNTVYKTADNSSNEYLIADNGFYEIYAELYLGAGTNATVGDGNVSIATYINNVQDANTISKYIIKDLITTTNKMVYKAIVNAETGQKIKLLYSKDLEYMKILAGSRLYIKKI